ncbi:uncharacterized protein [Maniola hyperantus]|uniref:uncharacterized protein n=1 Tax=Aphantopus hyperantus TaxID=2795564 RepID=UPI003747F84C
MKPETRSKFTRGEKCILAHLVLTIVVIIVLLIIYLIHVLVVDHSGPSSVFDTRRVLLPSDNGLHKFPVGLLYYVNVTPIRNICNTLLLTQEWSVSAGHCVAMRVDPGLSNLLYDWRIKYSYDIEGNKIIRSIVHPHFNRDTFADNVGLIQHNPLSKQRYKSKYP